MAKFNQILLFLVTHFSFIYLQKCPLMPVVIGGSRLEAKLNRPEVPHIYCIKNSFGYFTLWLDVKQLFPITVNCWVNNMKLNYDSSSNKTFNQPGVITRVPGFSNPEEIEYLTPKTDEKLFGGYSYMSDMVDGFLRVGYRRMKNLFAAPYDFRKGPSELTSFFDNFNKLIEDAYDYNNSSVILIGHSLGGQLILNFLQNKTQQWKNKYIRGFVSLSAPFGGTVKALKVFAAGDNMGIFLMKDQVLREVLVTMPSIATLIPNKEVFGDEVLVSTTHKDYTLDDLQLFFDDIGTPDAWKMYLNERKFSDLSPPGVELHCFHGSGIATIKRLIYGSNSFPDDPLMEYENGDGTASLRSLKYCKTWITEQKERVETKAFDGINHMDIIKNKWVLHYITKTVTELSYC